MKKYIYLLLLFFTAIHLNAQVGINTDNSDPDASAMLDVKSTNKGVLIPRMSSTERQQILEPAVGLMVYDSTAQAFYYFNGMGWLELLSGSVTVLADADDDTKIQVEESADEDLIRFDLGGTEQMIIQKTANDNTQLAFPNNTGGIFIGASSGNAVTTGIRNIAIGSTALATNQTGSFSVAVGNSALKQNKASHNTGIGDQALERTTTGGLNTALGSNALFFNTTGGANIGIGTGAGFNNRQGANNVFVGIAAGRGETNHDKSNNVMVGYEAGRKNEGDGNIFIGHKAGRNATGDNKLYIENSLSDAPLIYGEFDNDLVRINGKLNINNTFSLPTIDGTANQILQTDGAGTVTWATHSDNVNDADADSTNELQQLSLSENTLSISNGNAVNLSSLIDDKDWVISSGTNITNNNEGNVGIGDMAPPLNRWKLTVKDTVNSMLGTDSIDVSELFAVFTRNLNENNTGVGIGFQSTSTVTGMGAAIVHERTNSNSRGKLHFATKDSGSAADEDLPIRMTIDEMGNVGIGITSPRRKLDVIGDGIIDGNLEVTGTYPGSDDQTIDVLSFDGTSLTISLEDDGETPQSVNITDAIIPIGTIWMYHGNTAPDGWLICDGSYFSVSEYNALRTLLGGNTLPDFRARFPMGTGDNGNLGSPLAMLGNKGGNNSHQLDVDEMPPHTHSINYRIGSESGSSSNNYSDLGGTGTTSQTGSTGGSDATDEATPFNITNPYYVVNFIIKAK